MLEELMSNMDVARHVYKEDPTKYNEFSYYRACCEFDNYSSKLLRGELERV